MIVDNRSARVGVWPRPAPAWPPPRGHRGRAACAGALYERSIPRPGRAEASHAAALRAQARHSTRVLCLGDSLIPETAGAHDLDVARGNGPKFRGLGPAITQCQTVHSNVISLVLAPGLVLESRGMDLDTGTVALDSRSRLE